MQNHLLKQIFSLKYFYPNLTLKFGSISDLFCKSLHRFKKRLRTDKSHFFSSL